jgi:RNA polymerase sigma-70 factor (ECF subfamily)
MDDEAGGAVVFRSPLDPKAERTLLEHRARFLEALQRRTGSRELAEDVLQAAYVRALERGTPAVGDEGVVAWFQAVLRNASLDGARKAGVEDRVARRLAAEVEEAVAAPEVRDAVCACVHDAIEELKPEYAEVIREVELKGRSLVEVAGEARITANNAGVRLHRARLALGRRLGTLCGACSAHGCLECHCKGS